MWEDSDQHTILYSRLNTITAPELKPESTPQQKDHDPIIYVEKLSKMHKISSDTKKKNPPKHRMDHQKLTEKKIFEQWLTDLVNKWTEQKETS